MYGARGNASASTRTLANASVFVEGNAVRVRSGPSGDYWRLLAPGIHTLRVEYPGCAASIPGSSTVSVLLYCTLLYP